MSNGGPARPTDGELVRAARAGSRAAFCELVARHEAGLFRFLRVRVGRADLAEELQQDAFVRCWTRLHLCDHRRPFAAWLFRLAANLASNRLRQMRLEGPPGEPVGEPAGGPDPALVAAARETRANVWDLVEKALPGDSRSALWLCYAEGLPAAAIGEILGRSEGAVRVLLFRARARLASLLDRADVSLEVR